MPSVVDDYLRAAHARGFREVRLIHGRGIGVQRAIVQSLLRDNLIDELMLTIHPIVLGTGRRLFTDGGPRLPLRLVDSKATSKGVIITNYQSE